MGDARRVRLTHDSAFTAVVAVPAVVAEAGLTLWLLRLAGKATTLPATESDRAVLVGV